MTTNHTTRKTPPPGSESASGLRSELDVGEYTTPDPDSQLATLQHRVADIRLKARVPGMCIALQIPGPVAGVLLTVEEARQLIGALASLIGDIEQDRRAREWSEQALRALVERSPAQARLYDAADASAESYRSKL